MKRRTGESIPRLVTAYPIEGDLMMDELDRFVLTDDLPEKGLRAGDLGTIVMVRFGPARAENAVWEEDVEESVRT
ncbi:MAG: hypothetical protein ACLFTE_11510 [Salinivenus sp.]